MKKSYLFIAASAALLTFSCKSKIDPDTPSAGSADFSVYVAMGNSLTAGFADGSLYRSGQENSYPNMLAGQFKLVGGGDFKQPLLPGESGWPIAPAAGRLPKRVLDLVTDCKGVTSLGPKLYSGVPDTAGSATNIAAGGPYNNVGIPGIRCIDYDVAGYGLANPYAGRFFSSPMQRPLDAALQPVPTFFTLWLGANDVLGYATAGGEGANGGINLTDISPLPAFTATYNKVVGAIVTSGRSPKGVLINIPDVTTIPYFTTINPKGLVLDATQAAQLSAAYAPLGISFTAGANYFIIEDEAAPGNLRQIKAGEYLLITTPGDSLKCGGWGSMKPIPKQYVLDASEVSNVKTATAAFNQVIADNANKYGLALMDANTYLKSLQSGVTWNGVTYTPAFVTGGAFSLDGIHLTPRGYALVANEIIRVANQTYRSSIPDVDVNKYSGVRFP
ncbi:SGNH/GDSL hydrolase family protein [Taibaiella koreensis]|uniref:SGNH/GDSL hydrolase family protein n=1 Tax=Taibaiella koreensis TaxID=1268548 RepID=UPI000E59E406|nr:SGNH/GDSL hydrolase family protein [Taibaiella koreensis]